MEAIEISDVAGITVGNTVLVESIGQWAFLDWAAFLLAVTANHENSKYSLSFSSAVLGFQFRGMYGKLIIVSEFCKNELALL